jgi:hypothetical protein
MCPTSMSEDQPGYAESVRLYIWRKPRFQCLRCPSSTTSEAVMQEHVKVHQHAESVRVVAEAFDRQSWSLLVADGWSYTKEDLAHVAVGALLEAGFRLERWSNWRQLQGTQSDGTDDGR